MMTFWQYITRRLKRWPEDRRFRVAVALVQQLFITLLLIYLILLLVETISPESVSRFLNLNYLLLAVILSGVITVLTVKDTSKDKVTRPVTRLNIFIIVFTGLGGAALIWYRTQDIGWLSYVVSLTGGSLIILLSLLIWKKDGYGESEGEDIQDS